jgi:RNA polymerase sigma-70 factor (ECF subfamily)
VETTTEFATLIGRVRAGDEQAAAELVRLYEPHVRRAVRIRLNQPQLRQIVDSLDICQSVLANFFVRTAAGQFRLETPQQLIALLVKMGENRVRDWQRRHGALRRDRRREVPLAALPVEPACPRSQGTVVDEVDPARALEQVLECLTPVERRIVERRRAGDSWANIARREQKSPDALRMQLRRAVDRALRDVSFAE